MKRLVLLILVAIIGHSCIKNNPDPSWIEIGVWDLQSNPNSQFPTGELTHNFTDAWVYIDDEMVGVFELPVKLPILKSGPVNIKIYPTIKNNGISATKKIYPFVNRYEVNVTLEKNKIVSLQPKTTYVDDVQFWVEEFEDAAVKIEDDPNTSAAQLTIGNDPSILKYGNFYGVVNLNQTDSMWVAYTQDMVLPKGKEVYLEIDYYNTNSLITGLIAISSASIKNNPNIQLNAQTAANVKWKKIYIDIKELVSNSQSADYFKQSFQAGLDAGDTEGVIVLDNIKVVHF